jgi:hypothetical protein
LTHFFLLESREAELSPQGVPWRALVLAYNAATSIGTELLEEPGSHWAREELASFSFPEQVLNLLFLG